MLARITLAAFLAAAILAPQSIDTGILGTVMDSTGAIIAAASVTITLPATGLVRTVTSAADGKYEVRYLTPGEYTVEVKAAGFRAERQRGVVLQLGQQARIDFSLTVGEVVETVEVSARAVMLQTENAAKSWARSASSISRLTAATSCNSPP